MVDLSQTETEEKQVTPVNFTVLEYNFHCVLFNRVSSWALYYKKLVQHTQEIFPLSGFTYANIGKQDKWSHEDRYGLVNPCMFI